MNWLEMFRRAWSAVQVASALAAATWLYLVLVNVQRLLATAQARSLADAVATAARMPIW